MTVVDEPQSLFRSEYEQEMESWLRRRFRSVCIAYMVVGAVVMVARLNGWFGTGPITFTGVVTAVISTALYVGVVAYFLLVGRHRAGAARTQLLKAASLMILLLGTISLVKAVINGLVTGTPDNILVPIFFWHFIACLFLPWTPRESLRPIVPLLVAWMLGVLFLKSDASISSRVLMIIFSPGILLPGLGICALRLQRHSESFRMKMVGQHFLTMRQEFTRARRIHESMFPNPHDDGHVRFEYTFTPMRELGGDFVHLHVGAEGLVHLTIIDVTGHGLAAALTVNRIYGELERLRAESPGAEPGEILASLNRYIHLTLVKHNIYATAMCITLDPYLGKLLWCNAGHPPAFLRGANGAVTPLESTTVLLGALAASEFEAEQRTIELSPGDVIVTYTDGTFEARDRQGQQLGLQQLNALIRHQPAPRNWPQFVNTAVGRHTSGHNEDDILIASLTFLEPRRQAQPHQAVAAAT